MQKYLRTDWKYRGRDVFISSTAEIPSIFRPFCGRYKGAITEALEQIEPWDETGSVVRRHCVTSHQLVVTSVELKLHEKPMWAVHVGHRARKPGLSPFIRRRTWPTTASLMIELIGTPDKPIVVRAYPNQRYIYPLPTMRGALTAVGGQEACIAFWKRNAYLRTSEKLLVGTPQTDPPKWWCM